MTAQRGAATGPGPGAAGFEEAFPTLFALAYRVSYRILGDRADGEDVAQEALARAHLRWIALGAHPEGWIVTVATRLAIDRVRRRRRAPVPRREQLALVDNHIAERLDLARALRRLPRRQREVVVLRYLADWAELEVAEALGCSPGTVKSHAARGLAALRRHLALDHQEHEDDVRASG